MSLKAKDKSGLLYVVATPIGNLSDMSDRARQVLSEVDLLLCEDTRQTAKLLSFCGITARTRSFHEHNETKMQQWAIGQLSDGRSLALVSDAGTPLISDPGFSLVREARKRGIRISPIPGPSAAVAALSVSGLPANRFCFEGFLPAQATRRRHALDNLKHESRTVIFYESSHRIERCLEDMAGIFGADRPVMVGREMTKLHETFFYGTLGEALHFARSDEYQRKGEFVVVIGGNVDADMDWEKACNLSDRLCSAFPLKEACRIAGETFSVNRNRLYRRMLTRTNE